MRGIAVFVVVEGEGAVWRSAQAGRGAQRWPASRREMPWFGSCASFAREMFPVGAGRSAARDRKGGAVLLLPPTSLPLSNAHTQASGIKNNNNSPALPPTLYVQCSYALCKIPMFSLWITDADPCANLWHLGACPDGLLVMGWPSICSTQVMCRTAVFVRHCHGSGVLWGHGRLAQCPCWE